MLCKERSSPQIPACFHLRSGRPNPGGFDWCASERNSNISDGAGAASDEKSEANAWRHHQDPDSTFDGTLSDDMSFEILRPEESSAK
jgi:hypothetical protein